MTKKWSNLNLPGALHYVTGNIKGFTGALKSLTARKIIGVSKEQQFQQLKSDKGSSIHQLWQESFKALPLWSAWLIWQKINYIHANPVKARLVPSARDYAWSSFRAFYGISTEPLVVDRDWWWPEDSAKLSKAVKELGWKSPQDWGRKK